MNQKKKLQVFVSSTYTDLQDERQAAVEGILGSNNIPAGMELFKAGNNSQLETIKKWIDDSDIYMLILGGRYGSIEPNEHKSYTQLEYEYAISKGIPIFAIVLSDEFLQEKAKINPDIYESHNKDLYTQFKKIVMSKMVKTIKNCTEIKLAIHESISELKEECKFDGWVRGTEQSPDCEDLLEKYNSLSKENVELKERLKNESSFQYCSIDDDFWIKEYTFNISVFESFMSDPYQTEKVLTMREIYTDIAPLIIVKTPKKSLKISFEKTLKEKYFPRAFGITLENNQFENLKARLFSVNLIELTTDENNNELINLSKFGISVINS